MRKASAILLVLLLLLSFVAAWAAEDDALLRETAQAALAACLTEDMTDVEKLTAIHDWLALHCDYGATKRGNTAYGALVEGTGNCVGYAEAYAYLTDMAGLEGTATYSEELDHAWIAVTLDGDRYFSDCTWDDGKYARLGLIRHRYWLFDESNALPTGHTGWDLEEAVPGGPLEDAPWKDAVTRVIFEGDQAYYIDAWFNLWRCSRSTWETELLYTVDYSWPDPENASGIELYTSLLCFGGRLFFNTGTAVYSIDMEGQEVRTVSEPELGEGIHLYGIAVRDGYLCRSEADARDAVVYDVVKTVPVRQVWGEQDPS